MQDAAGHVFATTYDLDGQVQNVKLGGQTTRLDGLVLILLNVYAADAGSSAGNPRITPSSTGGAITEVSSDIPTMTA